MDIELTGLRPDVPIGAMAAFGALRIATRSFRDVKLGWRSTGGGWHAVLSVDEVVGRDEVVEAIMVSDRELSRIAERWPEQIKTMTRDEFRDRARACPEWFAAFGNDLVVDDRDGKIEPTPFDMSVARQKFLADALKLAKGLASDTGARAAYEEALFGPWRYKDDQHSLGWDPSTMKLGAFTHKAPTGMANAGVRAAVWVAFESLPLFPCCYHRGLAVRSFRRSGKEVILRWPVWRSGIGLRVLETLLGSALVNAERPDAAELSARGVVALYESARFKPNKYLASFRPAQLVWAEPKAQGA